MVNMIHSILFMVFPIFISLCKFAWHRRPLTRVHVSVCPHINSTFWNSRHIFIKFDFWNIIDMLGIKQVVSVKHLSPIFWRNVIVRFHKIGTKKYYSMTLLSGLILTETETFYKYVFLWLTFNLSCVRITICLTGIQVRNVDLFLKQPVKFGRMTKSALFKVCSITSYTFSHRSGNLWISSR